MNDQEKPIEARDRCVVCSCDVTNKPARAAKNRTPRGLVWVGPVCLSCWGGETSSSERAS